MAHDLTTRTAKAHQALHGYADGHRQLALSTTLKPRDQKTLLGLSDISGPGARLHQNGYLTGYPLAESGFYALARTWPASEMPRPGCVWTHTLLIDFTELAALESLTFLQRMFRRPQSAKAAADYSKQVTTDSDPEEQGFPSLGFDEDWALLVMAGLYGNPRSTVVVGRSEVQMDDAVLRIWSQQWPRLRRSFRFCTGAASDRLVDGESFDLLVLPSSDRNVRARLGATDDKSTGRGPWLDYAFYHLISPYRSDLRAFFRRAGADVAGGRQAFRPLCQLHRAITRSRPQPEAVRTAIAILHDEFGAFEAQTARAIVAAAALETADSLDEGSFAFLWDNLTLVDAGALASGAGQLGRSAWRRAPAMLVPLLDTEKFRFIAERTLAELDVTDLAKGLARAPTLQAIALARRPELVGQPSFWAGLEMVDDAFLTANREHMETVAVEAILSARRDDLATRTVREFGSSRLLRSINASSESIGDRLGAWLRA
jgi:GTPase-associated protein 1, N-terminal domain type 1